MRAGRERGVRSARWFESVVGRRGHDGRRADRYPLPDSGYRRWLRQIGETCRQQRYLGDWGYFLVWWLLPGNCMQGVSQIGSPSRLTVARYFGVLLLHLEGSISLVERKRDLCKPEISPGCLPVSYRFDIDLYLS